MATLPKSPDSNDMLARIVLALGNYPVLASRIRARMRRELFEIGIIQSREFENEVRRISIQTQKSEGLTNPVIEEPSEMWEFRQEQVRAQLTDILFSQNISFETFQSIVNEVLSERGVSFREIMVAHNPEVQTMQEVLKNARAIEAMPEHVRGQYLARLIESKVVLIRSLISDQLPYINIAKEWFTLADLGDIIQHKIGSGRIGGKAAGMLLAHRILTNTLDENLRGCLQRPLSYYIGSDELYYFMAINNLFHWNDQKYKSEAEMRADYPQIVADFERGDFPVDLSDQLRLLLETLGSQPLIVRSSSLLEDSFGTAFPGKYESVFCPNQADLEENLAALKRAIARVYASTLNPNALLYRRARGLQDYDERMGLLLQVVQGQAYGQYYLPHGAGVAFSRNLFRWTPQIRREDGFVRLVWGLGTRAVDRVGNDYPRPVALSHPQLRPSNDPKSIRHYSQQYVDLIDLKENSFKTLPVSEVLGPDYPALRYLGQVYDEGDFAAIRTRLRREDMRRVTLTFDEMLKRTPFAERVKRFLRQLEQAYHNPVDLEFTVDLINLDQPRPDVCITVLQCRPQSQIQTIEARIPPGLKEADTVFSTHFVVPQGNIPRVDFVLFVPPEGYFSLPTAQHRTDLVRAISRLNNLLAGQNFICVGPGRWGSSNSDLGVSIDYGDIYNARALVELAGEGIGLPPEPSLGTHFFQDLLESQIYPLAIYLDDARSRFDRAFFYDTPDHTADYFPLPADLQPALRLIRVADARRKHHLRVVMDDEAGQAAAFFESSGPA